MHRFHPKLLDTLPGYTKRQLGRDLSAGLTVGVLALPLAMAFAIASGATPSAGIWTAIVAGLIISLFGGSRVQIGGPTGAFIPIVYAIVAGYGFQNMLVATVLAGVLLLAMGFSGLGSFIRYIPISVVIGFTNGIAVVIFLSQIKDFFGLQVGLMPSEFFGLMKVLFAKMHTLNVTNTLLALGSLALVVVWDRVCNPAHKRYGRKLRGLSVIPSQLVALIVGTLVSVVFALPVETIGTRFHGIPQAIPLPSFPIPTLESLGKLLSPAITIALLGAIESLLSARVADTHIGDRHDPNQELIAQGMANVVCPFFGGIAATGAIARTSTNVRAGGRTPVAGIVHAVTLLLIVLVAAPLAAYIPIATLAAIVMFTAMRMGEWHEFRRLKSFSWNYRIILLTTFLLTVLFDLTVAVEIGMVLASLFFIYRMQALTVVEPLTITDQNIVLPAYVSAFALRGSLFFGTVAKLDAQLDLQRMQTRVIVLDMRNLINIDTSGIDWLCGVQRTLVSRGGSLVLSGLGYQSKSIVDRSGCGAQIGADNLCADLDAALRRGREISLQEIASTETVLTGTSAETEHKKARDRDE